MNVKGKQRETVRVTGNKKGVVGEVTGFLGILDHIDEFGEAKRDNKVGKREERKRSCSSDAKSKFSGDKKCNNKKRPAGPRKVSVSVGSDNSRSEDYKSCDHKRRGGSSDSEDDISDTESESSCSKKSDKGKRGRKLAECVGRKCKKNHPKILAQTRIHT